MNRIGEILILVLIYCSMCNIMIYGSSVYKPFSNMGPNSVLLDNRYRCNNSGYIRYNSNNSNGITYRVYNRNNVVSYNNMSCDGSSYNNSDYYNGSNNGNSNSYNSNYSSVCNSSNSSSIKDYYNRKNKNDKNYYDNSMIEDCYDDSPNNPITQKSVITNPSFRDWLGNIGAIISGDAGYSADGKLLTGDDYEAYKNNPDYRDYIDNGGNLPFDKYNEEYGAPINNGEYILIILGILYIVIKRIYYNR